MLTLIKLRLNSPMQDLAYRFSIHCSTVSRIFKKWVVILDTRLKPLLLWPERDDLRRTMPECFRAKFNDKVAVITRCAYAQGRVKRLSPSRHCLKKSDEASRQLDQNSKSGRIRSMCRQGSLSVGNVHTQKSQ